MQYGFPILNSVSASLTGGASSNTLFHDFDPGAWGGDVLRLIGPSGGFSITGISGGFDGRMVMLINKSGSTITLEHEETASSASNRLSMGGSDFSLLSGRNIILYYDGGDARWTQFNNA